MSVTGSQRVNGADRSWRMTPRVRKTMVIAHVISSVGWLGLNLGILTLVLTGLTTDDPGTQHAAFLVLGLFGDLLLIPISLLAFVTGVVLSLGTPWGLLRQWWVIVKFALTLIAVVLIPLSLLPGIHDMVDAVTAAGAEEMVDTGDYASGGLAAGFVSTTMYVTNVVLSILKPWGRTGFSRRRRRVPGAATAV